VALLSWRASQDFKMRSAFIVFSLFTFVQHSSASGDTEWNDANSVMDLIQQYSVIFPNGNRNAASHRWATYILERSKSLDRATFEMMFSGFCPVSGSPISRPGAYNLWEMDLRMAGRNTTITGGIYFCCWPCVCDTSDFIQVDTKTVEVADGTFEFHFLVLGDPCLMPNADSKIPAAAPDAICQGDTFVKATHSDNGYVIIGLLQDLSQLQRNDENLVSQHCASRADQGYQSGMGTIFREVAEINPIKDPIEVGGDEISSTEHVKEIESTSQETERPVDEKTESPVETEFPEQSEPPSEATVGNEDPITTAFVSDENLEENDDSNFENEIPTSIESTANAITDDAQNGFNSNTILLSSLLVWILFC